MIKVLQPVRKGTDKSNQCNLFFNSHALEYTRCIAVTDNRR